MRLFDSRRLLTVLSLVLALPALASACRSNDADPSPADVSDANGDPPDVRADASDDADDDSSANEGGPASCAVTAPSECPDPAPRYADIAPIIEQRCLVCHNGLGPHWPLVDYDHVASWSDDIRGDMLNCSMPPADAGVAITVREREQILAWIRCGLPQ